MKKTISISLVIVVLSLVFSGFMSPVLAKQKPMVLKMVTFLPDVPPGNIWPHLLVDKVAAISKGELIIKIIGGPEAIPMSDTTMAVKRGVIDMASIVTVFAESTIPGIEILGLAEYSSKEIRENGTLDAFKEMCAKAGLYPLGTAVPSDAQKMQAFFLKKEITSIDELKGLKIASPGGLQSACIESLGAVCIPIAYPDFYTAMERGAVDGYVHGVPGIMDFGLEPVTGCMLEELFTSPTANFFMNLKKYNSLPQKYKDYLDQAAAEVDEEGAVIFNQVVDFVKTEIAKKGVKVVKFSHDESVKFYKLYRESMTADTLQRNPSIFPKLQNLIQNPEFHRLK
jgi:TRAP-type transport system periplasmic protein